MNRRDWVKALGAVGALKALELPVTALGRTSPARDASASAANQLETEIIRLKLRHTWTTTMSSSEYRDTLHVRFTRDGITGHGEGAPIVRYQENAVDAQRAAQSVQRFGDRGRPLAIPEADDGGFSSRAGTIRRQSRSRHRPDGLGWAKVGGAAVPLLRP